MHRWVYHVRPNQPLQPRKCNLPHCPSPRALLPTVSLPDRLRPGHGIAMPASSPPSPSLGHGESTASRWGDSDRNRERTWRGDGQQCAISRDSMSHTRERYRNCTTEQARRGDGQCCAAALSHFCNFSSHGSNSGRAGTCPLCALVKLRPPCVPSVKVNSTLPAAQAAVRVECHD